MRDKYLRCVEIHVICRVAELVELFEAFEVFNLTLVIVGGFAAFSVLRGLRGGTMASAVVWLLAAGGVFAIHEVIGVLSQFLPHASFLLLYSFSETVFAIVLAIGVYMLRRALFKGV